MDIREEIGNVSIFMFSISFFRMDAKSLKIMSS